MRVYCAGQSAGAGPWPARCCTWPGWSQRPNVVVQVIPAGAGAHEGLRGGAFMIADFGDAPSAAYQDTAARGQIIEYSDDLISLTCAVGDFEGRGAASQCLS